MRRLLLSFWILALGTGALALGVPASPPPAGNPALAPYDSLSADLEAFYIDLHQTPELSMHEEKTAAKVADRLRKLGYEVTTGVGGNGVVAILKVVAQPVLRRPRRALSSD